MNVANLPDKMNLLEQCLAVVMGKWPAATVEGIDIQKEERAIRFSMPNGYLPTRRFRVGLSGCVEECVDGGFLGTSGAARVIQQALRSEVVA